MVNNKIQDPGSYFLRKASYRAAGEIDADESEKSPTELNTINSSGGFAVVSPDKLSVKYTGVHLHGHDVGVVQANLPAPVKRAVYYFEMKVVNAGVKGQVAIGFSTCNFKMRRQPGWETNSYGYHGDDGMLYHGHGNGDAFGPTYTTGDIVGCGINYFTEEFFFTKNGEIVGHTIKNIKCPLYPTVSVHSQNEEPFYNEGYSHVSYGTQRWVMVNFGKEPFEFDIKAFEAQERRKKQATAESTILPQNVSHGIVRSYLLHYGYEDTLNSLDLAGKTSVPPVSQDNGFGDIDITYALSNRKLIRQLIRNGEIDATINKLREWYPHIIQDATSVGCFLLYCQKFVELVRAGKLEDALMHGRDNLAGFFELPDYKNLVKDCVALLAYKQPQSSPVGYLLEDSQKEMVADAVNAMVLSTNPDMKDSQSCLYSCLERILRQLTASSYEKRSLFGDEGDAFNLRTSYSL